MLQYLLSILVVIPLDDHHAPRPPPRAFDGSPMRTSRSAIGRESGGVSYALGSGARNTMVQAALAEPADAPDAAPDDNPPLDIPEVPWPMFVAMLLANGWIVRIVGFDKKPGEDDNLERRARTAMLRIAGFAALWIAGAVLLPVWAVALLFAAWLAMIRSLLIGDEEDDVHGMLLPGRRSDPQVLWAAAQAQTSLKSLFSRRVLDSFETRRSRQLAANAPRQTRCSGSGSAWNASRRRMSFQAT
jgi:hypothetical protein